MEEENTKEIFKLSIKKIVVIGPESTGKSTLSEALARQLNTLWVPEYAREYLVTIKRTYSEKDLIKIASGQVNMEERLSEQANKLLICDTDLNVIKVWSEHKYNRCHRWILEQIAERRYDLYLLTYIDVIWEDDPLREHSDLNMRRYFYNQYKDIVVNSGIAWKEIKGNHEERLYTALMAINDLLTN